jgi:hypothetical protein
MTGNKLIFLKNKIREENPFTFIYNENKATLNSKKSGLLKIEKTYLFKENA